VLVAKAEHRDGWFRALTRRIGERPGFRDPDLLRFVDRSDPASVLRQRDRLIGELAAGRSVVVHVEGTRATSCRRPVVGDQRRVRRISRSRYEADIVPLRFTGGLAGRGQRTARVPGRLREPGLLVRPADPRR